MSPEKDDKGKKVQDSIRNLDKLESRIEPLEEKTGRSASGGSAGPLLSVIVRCSALEGVSMHLVPRGLSAGGTTAGGTTAGGTTAGGTTAGGTTAGGTTAGGTTAGGTTAGGTTAGGTTAGGTTAGGATLATGRGAGLIEVLVDLRSLEGLDLRIIRPEAIPAGLGGGTTAGGTTAGGTTAGGTTAGGTTAGGTTAGGSGKE